MNQIVKNEIIQDWINVLQCHVATLVDNELPGVSQAVVVWKTIKSY